MKNIFKRPETLIGVGIGGFISAAVMAGKASVKLTILNTMKIKICHYLKKSKQLGNVIFQLL